MAITTEQIKELRQATGAGIMDCKDALSHSNGDYKKAIEFLRDKGFAKSEKRADREASEGVVELYNHGDGRVGVMVEVNCETDFVGRSEGFRTFAHELALQIAASSPLYITDEDIPEEDIEAEKNLAREKAIEDGKPENIIEKIITGRIEKFKEEKVLMRQKYIRDDSVTIIDMVNEKIAFTGEKIVIRRFSRWELGELSSDEEESEE